MIYTKYEDPWIDQEIQIQLDAIIDIIKQNISPNNLQSIILSGGFGRGEGSIVVEKQRVRPLKDYDIFVIVKEKPSKSVIRHIHNNAYDKLKLTNPENEDFRFSDFVIDINFTTEKLLCIRPDIFTYELKNASKVLWGEDVRKCITWMIEDIPPITTLRFLFEKATGLIAHFPQTYNQELNIINKDKFLLTYECYKTYVEICTTLCFYMGCYVPSYEIRSNLFQENYQKRLPSLYELLPELPDKVKECTQFKLKPEFEDIAVKDMAEIWINTRDDLLIVLKFLLEKYLNIKIKDWYSSYYEICTKMEMSYHKWLPEVILGKANIENKYFIDWANLCIRLFFNWKYTLQLLNNKRVLRLKPLVQPYSVIISTFNTVPLILLSPTNTIYGHQAVEILSRFSPCNPLDNSWDNLRSSYLSSYYLYEGPR